jgi:hypothetical protein
MTNEKSLQKIIAAYTPLDYKQIKLNLTLKDKYIAAEYKNSFCNDICMRWKNIDSTQLHNDMFVSLKAGEDILKIIKYVLA